MKAASCFSGIGAPELGGPQFDWVWCAEVEKFPSAVLAKRFPQSVNLGDVTADDFLQRASAFGPLDLLVGGPPCQSFSLAGLRKGMADPRGNLTLRYLAIIDALKPTFAVFENVPGMLSDKTDAFSQLLDAFEEIGYVVDVDIHDAQWFGVAQRRRRIFVCAQRVDSILSEKTLTSAQTIAQLLAENLLLTLAVARGPSTIVSNDLVFDASDPSHSLRKRMKLFGLDSASEPVSTLAERLAESLASFECELSVLDLANGSAASRIFEAIASCPSTIRTEPLAASQNIGKSWSATLAAPCEAMRSCITSTAGSAITESTIFGCALAALHISERITRSTTSLPTYWSAGLSSLTALKAFIDYARQATSDLFADQEWVRPWLHFIREAEPASIALGNIGVECFGEILPISESLSGNSPPRREAGQGTAGTISARTQGGGGLGTDFELGGGLVGFGGGNTSGPIDVATAQTAHGQRLDFDTEAFIVGIAGTLPAGGNGTGGDRHPGTSADTADTMLIAHTLRGEGFDASEDGTGRGTPIVPVAFTTEQTPKSNMDCALTLTKQSPTGGGQIQSVAHAIQAGALRENPDSGPDGIGVQEGGAYTLEARAEVQAVAFAQNQRDELRTMEIAGALAAEPGMKQTTYIQQAWQVRRLTPVECHRLQGFPDDHCAIEYRGKIAADGPQYKALGNSWAVPNGAWIIARIARHLEQREAA